MEVPKLVELDGLWWPASDWACRAAVKHEMDEAVNWMRRHCHNHSLIVQAGGNVGAYPLELAKTFEIVMTVEPDPINFLCLGHNIRGTTILARNCALGETDGDCSMVVIEEHNCGAHQVRPGGHIPVRTIDGLKLEHCGAIWLDVEGCELAALKGAAATIQRLGPTIATEEKGLGGPDGEIALFLGGFGYRELSRCGADRIYGRD